MRKVLDKFIYLFLFVALLIVLGVAFYYPLHQTGQTIWFFITAIIGVVLFWRINDAIEILRDVAEFFPDKLSGYIKFLGLSLIVVTVCVDLVGLRIILNYYFPPLD